MKMNIQLSDWSHVHIQTSITRPRGGTTCITWCHL